MNDSSRKPRRVKSWLASKAQLRKHLAAGLVIAIPIWITYMVVSFVFRFIRDASFWLVAVMARSGILDSLFVSWSIEPQTFASGGFERLPLAIQWAIGLFAVGVMVLLLYALGVLTANVVGERFIRLGETVVAKVPIVKVVYQATKQVVSMMAGGTSRPFKKVVLVPFPTAEMRSLGFVTKVIQDEESGETFYTVFAATAPNPTTGFVVVLKKSDVIELDWNVEDAVKTLISAGVLMPDEVVLRGQSSQ